MKDMTAFFLGLKRSLERRKISAENLGKLSFFSLSSFISRDSETTIVDYLQLKHKGSQPNYEKRN